MTTELFDVLSMVQAAALEPLTLEDDDRDAIVIDAIVVVRYQRAEDDHPRIAFTASESMSLAAQVGVLLSVADRVRVLLAEGWDDV